MKAFTSINDIGGQFNEVMGILGNKFLISRNSIFTISP